jgi:hypothetical protein
MALFLRMASFAVAALLVQPAFAQEAPASESSAQPAPAAVALPPAPAVIIEPARQENVLRAGTEIPMLLREELTTKKKKLRVGQRVQLEVANNITVGGVTVVPAGTPAVAELTEVRNKGMWGKSGYVAARIISMRLGDRQVRLSGTFDDKGVTGTAGVVASVALIPVVGFFTTGTSAEIPMGATVKAFLDEDIAFRPATTVQP